MEEIISKEELEIQYNKEIQIFNRWLNAFVYWEGIGGKKSRNCKRIL